MTSRERANLLRAKKTPDINLTLTRGPFDWTVMFEVGAGQHLPVYGDFETRKEAIAFVKRQAQADVLAAIVENAVHIAGGGCIRHGYVPTAALRKACRIYIGGK